MRKKDKGISESAFWDAGRFDPHEHIETVSHYDKGFEYGRGQVKKYLNPRLDSLTVEDWREVHGRLFGEIYGSSGEFKSSFDVLEFTLLKKQNRDLANPDLSQEEKLQLISEQHVELVEAKAFHYGNEEAANLVTEWRMNQAFGEHQWQGLDRVDAQNWDRAVERGETKILAGFLENQLQEAINYEQNPLGGFQQEENQQGEVKPTRKERKEHQIQETERQQRMAELNAKGESYRQGNGPPRSFKEQLLVKLEDEKMIRMSNVDFREQEMIREKLADIKAEQGVEIAPTKKEEIVQKAKQERLEAEQKEAQKIREEQRREQSQGIDL